MNTHRPIILFDGICNLCNRSVQFIILHDKKKQFQFAALQSDIGQNFLEKGDLKNKDIDSFVLIIDNRFYIQSEAALRVLRTLGWPWSLLYFFIIVPTFIRNKVYQLIARNRYKWFGKKEECMIPNKDLKDRFLQ